MVFRNSIIPASKFRFSFVKMTETRTHSIVFCSACIFMIRREERITIRNVFSIIETFAQSNLYKAAIFKLSTLLDLITSKDFNYDVIV